MDKERNNESLLWPALAFSWELGYSIAVPLIVLALLGRFLDRKFDSSPILFLIGIFLSIVISSTIVYLKAVKIIAKSSINSDKIKEDKK